LLTLSIPGSRHVEKRRYFVEAKYILWQWQCELQRWCRKEYFFFVRNKVYIVSKSVLKWKKESKKVRKKKERKKVRK
jgi:hypothetical protein